MAVAPDSILHKPGEKSRHEIAPSVCAGGLCAPGDAEQLNPIMKNSIMKLTLTKSQNLNHEIGENAEMASDSAVGNGTTPMRPLRLREKDHQHGDRDNDERRQDQKQIGALGMLAASVVGVFPRSRSWSHTTIFYLRL